MRSTCAAPARCAATAPTATCSASSSPRRMRKVPPAPRSPCRNRDPPRCPSPAPWVCSASAWPVSCGAYVAAPDASHGLSKGGLRPPFVCPRIRRDRMQFAVTPSNAARVDGRDAPARVLFIGSRLARRDVLGLCRRLLLTAGSATQLDHIVAAGLGKAWNADGTVTAINLGWDLVM